MTDPVTLSCYFTPPTITYGPVEVDAPPIWNRLMRYYPTRPRGQAVWQLADGTYSFNQPYPTVFPGQAARGDLWPNPNNLEQGVMYVTSNLVAVTVLRVFYGGHVYTIDQTTCANISAFLTAEGYNPDDWISHPQGVLAES